MAIRIGVCGIGRFSPGFVRFWNAHPMVEEVVISDLLSDRAQKLAEEVGVKRVFSSLDELCESDVDAIAIFTQRHLHAPMAVQAMEAGKDVYSAVPIGISMDEIEAVVRATERTGRIYMMGETSYYYPCTILCREKFRNGEMGEFAYAESQYLHDMEHMYESFRRSGGDDWKRVAGIPPMFYCSHSVSMILSVTGAHAVKVSCLGYEDHHEDAIFRKGANEWDNVFSNQSALLRTSDGGVARVNEMRRVGFHGADSVYMNFYGTEACYEQNPVGTSWITKGTNRAEDITEQVTCTGQDTWLCGYSPVHPKKRLPESFEGLLNGHSGSHAFLADDFVQSCVNRHQPPCNVWNAARWTVPGLIAHESAKRGGAMLEIPDLGAPR